MLTTPRPTDAATPGPLPFGPSRRVTAVRRLQSGFALVALVVVGAGMHRAGWLGADLLAPESTLQTARVPVAAVRATAPMQRDAQTEGDTTEADIEAARSVAVAAAPVAAPIAAPVVPSAPTPSAPASAADAASIVAEEARAERGTVIASGIASYYGRELAGRPTASGERFNPEGMTAAHRTLPLGTRIRVTNPANGRSVVVRVNDRGPFIRGRILDLSHGAARAIGLVQRGHGRIEIERLGRAGRNDVRAERNDARVERRLRADDAPVRTPIQPVADSTEG